MREHPGAIPPEESGESAMSNEAFDERWYKRFYDAGNIQSYEYFEGNSTVRELERQRFERGEIENPTLDYPKLDVANLEARDQALQALKQEILATEQHPSVKAAYRWRINEKLAEIRLMKAAATSDMRKFHRYTQFVYGKPSPNIFAYMMTRLREYATEQQQSDHPEIAEFAKELLSILPESNNSIAISKPPSANDIDVARQAVEVEFHDLVQLSSEAEEFIGDALKQEFELGLQKLQAVGWRVKMVERGSVSADQENRLVKVPKKSPRSRLEVQQLLLHEVGTHVKRRVNGERTQLQLLGSGLDRYEGAEEGVATMREEAFEGQFDDFRGMEGYLAIGLAQGLDGKKRAFREVYDVMRAYYLLDEMASGKNLEAAIHESQRLAWNRAVRTFRGTDCKMPGTAFTKDMIYREGYLAAWDLVREHPEELVRLSMGKFDPNNSRHCWVLSELGIRDEDMEALEGGE